MQPSIRRFLAATALLLAGCSDGAALKRFSIQSFGTTIEIAVFASPEQFFQVRSQLQSAFRSFHTQWQAWGEGGLLHAINTAIDNGRGIKIPLAASRFLRRVKEISISSGGYFNPAAGKLFRAWGFHTSRPRGPPPDSRQIRALLGAQPLVKNLYWEDGVLHSSNDQVLLDLGGIAKGNAAEMALQVIRSARIESALISIGGDVTVIGQRGVGRPWRIGIRDPATNGAKAVVALCDGESAYTSGDYERYYLWHEKKYHHIINPLNGYPADDWASATVIHRDAMVADAAATALISAGSQWRKVAMGMGIAYALLIDHAGEVTTTEGWGERACLS